MKNVKLYSMKIKHYIQITFVVCVGTISISGIMNTSGPGAGYTGAPGESNCTTCHSGTLITSGSNWNNIEIVGDFPGGGYAPDSTYSVSVRYRQTGITKFGFQTTPLIKSSNAPAGSIGIPNNRVQRYTRNFSGQTRQYAGHTNSGTSNMGGDSTRWTFAWTAPSSDVGPVVFYLNVNATNSNSQTSGDIVYSKTIEIPISPLLPVATASTNDTNICNNSVITLNGNGTNNPTSYFWTFTGAQTSSSTAQNPNVRFNTTGTQLAILRVQNATGVSKLDTLRINVLPSPTSTFAGPTSRSICEGDSFLVVANNVANSVYMWLPGNVMNDSIWVKQSGQYRVTTTDTSSGCSAVSGNFTLNAFAVPAQPTIAISSSDTQFCDAISDTVFLSGSVGGSYIWTVNGVNTTTGNTFFALSTSTDVDISVRAQTISTCVSEPSNLLSLKVIPLYKVSALQSIQTTSSQTTLTWRNADKSLGYQLSLDSGKTFSQTFTDSFITVENLQPNTPYLLTLRNLQDAVCILHDTTIEVTTLPCSDIRFSIHSPNEICEDSEYVLTINGLAESNYSVSFNNGPFETDTIYRLFPTTSGSVLVQIIDSNSLSCPTISRTLSYTIIEKFKDLVVKNETETVCSLDTFIYETSPGFDSIIFSLNGKIMVSTLTLSEIYGFQNSDTLLAFAIKDNCATPLQSIIFNTIQQPSAIFDYENEFNTYTFRAEDLNADKYQWILDYNPLTNDTTKSILVAPQITYTDFNRTVNVSLNTSNSDACFAQYSKEIFLTDNLNVALLKELQLQLYPNPFQDYLYVSNTSGTTYDLVMRSSVGQELVRLQSQDVTKEINVSNLAAGVYYIQITYKGEVATLNFIKN